MHILAVDVFQRDIRQLSPSEQTVRNQTNQYTAFFIPLQMLIVDSQTDTLAFNVNFLYLYAHMLV
jgi:hypothetical protein